MMHINITIIVPFIYKLHVNTVRTFYYYLPLPTLLHSVINLAQWLKRLTLLQRHTEALIE